MVRSWLMSYAWLETTDADREAVVECILAQGDWDLIHARADQYSGAQFDPGPQTFDEGVEWALSALYECHDEPHLATCPNRKTP